MAWMENGDVENRSFEMQGVSAEVCNMHLVGVLEEDDVSQSPLTQQTVANCGDHQNSSPFVDFGCLKLLDSNAIDGMLKLMCAGNTVEQNRTADVDNLSEQPQRDRIDEKMKSLQQFIPNSSKVRSDDPRDRNHEIIQSLQELIASSKEVRPDDPRDRNHEIIQSLQELRAFSNEVRPDDPRDRNHEIIQSLQELIASSNETDKASIVVEAIEYIKGLQRQVEFLSMRSAMRSERNQPEFRVLIPRSQMAFNMGMGMVDVGATGSGQGLIPVTSATGPAVPHNMSVPGTIMEAHDPHFIDPSLMDPRNSSLAHLDQAMQIQQRCNVEQLGMVHQSSSKGNTEVMNYGVNDNRDHYWSGMTENASEGYRSESNTSSQPDGPDDTFIFPATSWNSATSGNSVNTQVFKERILKAICDLDDRTFGQNSKLQVNVRQCQEMVKTIVNSKCYLMGKTCETLADPIYKELFRIAKKADLIVQECSEEPLNLKSILAEMDNICAFVAVIVDWQSCTRLFRKDMHNWTWASVRSRLEQLKGQDIQKNKELWDPRIEELRQLMSNAGGSRRGERTNLADYVERRVQNVTNADGLPQGLLPWCNLASDPEAKRGDFLGKGAFGSVYQYTWFGMACAEKSFNPFLCQKHQRDFEKEVGVMVRLNHPHVVRLICCHEDCTKPSIVMELMPTNLEMYIKQRKPHKPFTPQAAVDVILQIASGMKYLHGQGIVHRDLKPNNILVSPNTNPELSADGYVEAKLADFGLAKTKVNTSSSMLHSKNFGAATWRAPEAFEDHKGHQRHFSAKRADVYSFGILCSQILSGQLFPFGYVPVGLRERVSSPQNERPFLPSNSNYPAQLLSLIEECWAPDPCMRPNFSTICSSLQEIKFSLLVCKSYVN